MKATYRLDADLGADPPAAAAGDLSAGVGVFRAVVLGGLIWALILALVGVL